jgi:hypothetical protein
MARVIGNSEDAANCRNEFTERLPRSVSSGIASELAFFETRLKRDSGVDELRIERVSGEASLLLTAKGKRAALDALRTALR